MYAGENAAVYGIVGNGEAFSSLTIFQKSTNLKIPKFKFNSCIPFQCDVLFSVQAWDKASYSRVHTAYFQYTTEYKKLAFLSVIDVHMH